jgi:hypothetical protein
MQTKAMPTCRELNNINILDAVKALGGHLADGSSINHASQLWMVEGMKFGITDQKWYNNVKKEGGAGTVKLVQHVLGCDYFIARDWLMEMNGNGAFLSYFAVDSSSLTSNNPPDESIPVPVKLDEQHWPAVRQYLVGTTVYTDARNSQRCLNADLVDRLYVAGLVGATSFATLKGGVLINATFVRENGGAFQRGTSTYSSFKATKGNRLGGCFIVKSEHQIGVAIVEAPIDAISLHQMRPELTVIALGGSNIHPKVALAHTNVGDQVFAGFDADVAGEAYTSALLDVYPTAQRLLPPNNHKDWNNVLQDQFGRVPETSKAIDF